MSKKEILEKYRKLKGTKPGSGHKIIATALHQALLSSPEIISDIIFDRNVDQETKDDILFTWSKDHTGSCSVADNPRWSDMVRAYIIPKIDILPESLRHTIKWYQQIHGL